MGEKSRKHWFSVNSNIVEYNVCIVSFAEFEDFKDFY